MKLLFHNDEIYGDTVYQLVLRKSYRKKVLKLTHDSMFRETISELKKN